MSKTSRTLVFSAIAVCLCAFIISYIPILRQSTSTTFNNNSTSFDNPYCKDLYTTFPNITFSSQHASYHQSVKSYWSQIATEANPGCVVRPNDVHELAQVIKLLYAAWQDSSNDDASSLRFAVRSGGHSPEKDFATVDGGILIDMSLFNGVKISDDKKTAAIGTGARWRDVSRLLDPKGLAVVAGRMGSVGVGGLALGGGISFFSPQYGMVCDNIEEYEIVLANGTIARVSAFQHSDLWRALKGGSGNYGIVTQIKAKAFESGNIWAGYAFWTSWQEKRALRAFHQINLPENYDKYAAGPIMILGYLQGVGLRIAACHFAYTKPEKWPPVFNEFKSIPRLWSTTKVQSISSSAAEFDRTSPDGNRQFQVTTTIKNDLDTFLAFNEIYTEKLKEVKKIHNGIWSLVFQHLSAAVTHKGEANVLGLDTRHPNDCLVIVLLSVSWSNPKDDELAQRVSREMLVMFEEVAKVKGTADIYRYLNYAASGQDPFTGYGTESKNFMQQVSREYDPQGFYQQAKHGGFKLDLQRV